jgi:predicted RNA-binding Zn ribbon-like protein
MSITMSPMSGFADRPRHARRALPGAPEDSRRSRSTWPAQPSRARAKLEPGLPESRGKSEDLPRNLETSGEFIGGRLCLDFVNTVDWRRRSDPEELLRDYAGLLDWSVRAGAVSQREARRLRTATQADAPAAAAAFEAALGLRESFYRAALAHAHAETPPEGDLAGVVRSYAQAVMQARLSRDGTAYEWAFDENADDLDRPWWPVAVSAVELLRSPELSRVRECEGRGCGWLFLDESRSHTRRWCSAASCGNRERVRRYYARTRRQA